MPKRKSCRKFYKELRESLTEEEVLTKSAAICRFILESNEYKHAETVFAYYPLGNEVNCIPVIEQSLKDGKRVVLPKTAEDCQMEFYEIKSLFDVEEGNFYVMEPKAFCQKISREAADAKAIVLVPGVVFDYVGNRFGYGKGYYDRYFARYLQLRRVGLAYQIQLSEKFLECIETDMKMHIIVTEDQVIRIES